MEKLILFILKIYQFLISPVFKLIFKGGCRFSPTCSDYAKEAISRQGIFIGGKLALKRIFRCHPLGGHGFDPVPGSI